MRRTTASLLLLIFSFSSLLPLLPADGGDALSFSKGRRMGLGSRPPGCVNKCYSCKPCTATLVASPHGDHRSTRSSYRRSRTARHDDENDGYYLLSWKCACRNKVFQP